MNCCGVQLVLLECLLLAVSRPSRTPPQNAEGDTLAKIGGPSQDQNLPGDAGATPQGLWSALFKPSALKRASEWYDYDVSFLEGAPDERLTVNFELDENKNPLKRKEMTDGFVPIDHTDQASRIDSLFSQAGARMAVTGFGDFLGTWQPNTTDLAHLVTVHRCSVQRDANGRLFLWWHTSPLVSLGSNPKSHAASLWRISTILSPATYLAEEHEGGIAFSTRFVGSVFAQSRQDAPFFVKRDGAGSDDGMIDAVKVPLRIDLGYLIPLHAEEDAIVRSIQLAVSVGNRVAATLDDGYMNHKFDPGFSFHDVLLSERANDVKTHDDELGIASQGLGQLWIPATRVFEYPGSWEVF